MNMDVHNQEFRNAVMESVREVIASDKKLLKNIVAEIMEESTFGTLIEEGDNGDEVSKDEIIKLLKIKS